LHIVSCRKGTGGVQAGAAVKDDEADDGDVFIGMS
jgi:hypothetical protein